VWESRSLEFTASPGQASYVETREGGVKRSGDGFVIGEAENGNRYDSFASYGNSELSRADW